jgi:hypothetical protein
MKTAPRILLAGLLLAVAYVGSYFACVEKSHGNTFSYDGKRMVCAVGTPVYHFGPLPQNLLAGFYAPIHALDVRFFRRSKWNWQFPLRP